MAQPLVLVSGFGSFEEIEHNPSGEIARALSARPPRGLRVVAGVLPVSFARAPAALDELLSTLEPAPSFFLGLGVQKKRGFRIEHCARARPKPIERRDVDGVAARNHRHEGPELGSEVDLVGLLARLRARSIDAYLSADAGGYVCERVYHHLLARGRERGVPALFVHVPPLRFTPLPRQVEVVGRILEELALT